MLAYIIVVFVLFLIPGPAVILTITKSVHSGLRAGLLTGLGIALGDLFHTIAAVIGLSAIFMTSKLAFEVVKYGGAIYLLYLGVKAMLEKAKSKEIKQDKKSENRSLSQAFIIELLNPKTALFFLAFLPQFVKADGLSVVIQLFILGGVFVLMSILYTSLLALFASKLSKRFFVRSRQIPTWTNKIVGLIYIGLGLQLLFSTYYF